MLEKYDVYLRPFNCQRTLHIYLPNDYYQSDERYPVVLYVLMDIICF